MSVLTVNSTRLNRKVFICDTNTEARQAWQDHPDDRGAIFLSSEVRLMGGITDEALQVIQAAKDVFPGATLKGFAPLDENLSLTRQNQV